jgi:hypothetical protein
MGNLGAAIDHIDKLQLSENEAKKYFNELRSLDYLAQGLWFLYYNLQRIEAKITEGVGKDKQVFIFGNAPEMQGINQYLVACAFHWYAVTVCNYVRMVGWLTHNQRKDGAIAYTKKIIPAVYLWRNKVAAHFAITDPKQDDNVADLVKSVMFPISFADDAFYTGSLIPAISTGGKKNISRQEMRWSLAHTHRNLIPRYWPPKQTT